MSYIAEYLSEVATIAQRFDTDQIHHCARLLAETKAANGRVFVLGVGGSAVKARVVGIVGQASGYTQRVADACIVVPTINSEHVTPHAESFQSVLCHLLVWHPALQSGGTKAMHWGACDCSLCAIHP
jgi:phosphoheptose isomerase